MVAEIIPQVYDYLSDTITASQSALPYTQTLLRILNKYRESNLAAIILPLLACQAAGAEPILATPAAAWRALHLAAHILDDVEDGDTSFWGNGESTSSQLINIATGFIAVANLSLMRASAFISLAQQRTLLQSFNRITMQMAGGQYIDILPTKIHDMSAYFHYIGDKSGTFFALAIFSGAVCAAVDDNTSNRYYKFGYNLGIIVQLLNDLVGFYTEDGHCDLVTGKYTLPVLFVEETAPESIQSTLQAILPKALHTQEARQQVRAIVKEQGGDAYMFAEITRYHALAINCLSPNDDPHSLLKNHLEMFLHKRLSLFYQLI